MSMNPNAFKGILGRKVGMTRVFDGDRAIPVTVIEAGPCVVTHLRTSEGHGYSAVALGYGSRKEKHLSKPMAGQFKAAGVDPQRFIREFRLDADAGDDLALGSVVDVSRFTEGEFIDVTGVSKGKGFAGVVKRYGFSGVQTVSHGTHESFRHGGSIGCRLTPGRVFPGKRMAGHMGSRRVTMQNIKIIRVDAERNLLLVKGAVPGAPGGLVRIQSAIKKKNPRRSRAN